eukprot:GGOE01061506.1.p1 GENE.GGOE01061506.1~~GGOE01061506.1.p1  ORF type:complete len:388 (+),score=105.60 GGOE01061506.1:155-1165(+)
MSSAKPALLVIPSPELAPFVSSMLLPGVDGDYAEVVVGTSVDALAPALARHEEVVIACGMFLPGLKQTVADLVGKSPKARTVWIHSFSAGVDHLLTPEVKGCRAPVTNAKGCFSQSLAEYALLGCMYFDKQVPRLQANKAAATWERFQMGELAGQTMGIVGFGDIGQAVGRLAAAFQMEVAVYRRTAGAGLDVPGVQVCCGEEGLDRLLRTADFVVAALPGTPLTHHFINAERLTKLKSTAVFINVGRGSCVDEAALADCLRHQRIRGACLDVFEAEPLPNTSPLWGLDNALLSPHNADNTRSYYPSTIRRFLTLSKDFFLKGQPFPSLVDLDQGY